MIAFRFGRTSCKPDTNKSFVFGDLSTVCADDDDRLVIAEDATNADDKAKAVKKPRRKHNRFNGMPEEEVAKRLLPDHIAQDLDILIVSRDIRYCVLNSSAMCLCESPFLITKPSARNGSQMSKARQPDKRDNSRRGPLSLMHGRRHGNPCFLDNIV